MFERLIRNNSFLFFSPSPAPQCVHRSISHRRAHRCLDQQFRTILESHHQQEFAGRDYTGKGDEHEGQTVEEVCHGRAAYGAYPEAFALGALLNLLHQPGVGEFAQEKSCERGHYDTRHAIEDMVIGSGRITGIVDGRTATKEEIGLLMTKSKAGEQNG